MKLPFNPLNFKPEDREVLEYLEFTKDLQAITEYAIQQVLDSDFAPIRDARIQSKKPQWKEAKRIYERPKPAPKNDVADQMRLAPDLFKPEALKAKGIDAQSD